ncbi:MarR family transcriptional regulator [Alcaligenaceae bacterium]|nr:MarR family transcriptional regulator [Alcaligenaceae bacterium]
MTALYDHELAPTGLRLTQYSLLATLWREGGQKGISLSDLAAVLDMDRTTLTRNLRPMTQRQFISIDVDATDGRMRRATLTAQGVAAFESAQPFWRIAQSRVDQALGKENVTALHQWVDSVIPAFREETHGANP